MRPPREAPDVRASPPGAPTAMALSVVRDEQGFAALRRAWDRLASTMPSATFAFSFAWAEIGWREVAAPKGRRLHIVVGHDGDDILLIWPLVTYRFKGYRKARWLGPEGSEYHDVLVEPGPWAEGRVADAFRWLRARGEIDVLHGQGLREDALARPFLEHVPAVLSRRATQQLIDTGRWQGFPDYMASRSANFRRDQSRQWRRLAKSGSFENRRIERSADIAPTVRWLHDQRVRALRDKGISSNWFTSPDYLRFLVRVSEAAWEKGNLALFELAVGEARIAALLGFRWGKYLELCAFGFDRHWHKFSPGRLIMEMAIAYGFESGGRWIDMRLGEEPYKDRWAEPLSFVDEHLAPLTWRGRALQGLRYSGPVRRLRRSKTDAVTQ